MPELPDIDVYVDVLARKLDARTLQEIRLGNPFFLRSVAPPPGDAVGKRVLHVRRLGKRIAVGLEGDTWLVIHLMISGRLAWHARAPALTAKNRIAAFDFDNGSLLVTEAGSKKRASLHLATGEEGLREHDPGGIEPLTCTYDAFAGVLDRENRTLKRSLTDPRLFSGIGNAYSDEILHAARLSPFSLSASLNDDARRRLFEAMRSTLQYWRTRLLDEAAGEMPSTVTAFRDGMAVHGRYGKSCPVCDSPIQRIRYRRNETNYCAACQTGSRILKDRALSRLLQDDWPDRLDEL